MQSLIKAGLYEEASQACTGVESPEYTERVLMLQVGGDLDDEKCDGPLKGVLYGS